MSDSSGESETIEEPFSSSTGGYPVNEQDGPNVRGTAPQVPRSGPIFSPSTEQIISYLVDHGLVVFDWTTEQSPENPEPPHKKKKCSPPATVFSTTPSMTPTLEPVKVSTGTQTLEPVKVSTGTQMEDAEDDAYVRANLAKLKAILKQYQDKENLIKRPVSAMHCRWREALSESLRMLNRIG